MPKEVQQQNKEEQEQNYFLKTAKDCSVEAFKLARMFQRYMNDGPHTEYEIAYRKKIIKEKLAEALAYRSAGSSPGFSDYDPEKSKDDSMPKETQDYIDTQEKGLLSTPAFNNMIDNCSPSQLVDLLGKQEFDPKTKDIEWHPVSLNEVSLRLGHTQEEMNARKDRMNDLLSQLDQSTQKSFTGKLKSWFVGNSKEYEKAYKAMKGLRDGTISDEQAKADIKQYLDLRGKKVRNHQYGKDRFDALMSGLATVMKPAEFSNYCKEIDTMRHDRDKNYLIGRTNPDHYKTTEQAARDQAIMHDESCMRSAMKDRKSQEAQRKADHSKLTDLVQYGIRKQFGEKNGAVVDSSIGNTLREENKVEMEAYLQNNPSVREAAKQIIDQFKLDIKVPPIREVPAELKQPWQIGDKTAVRPGSPEDQVMKNAAQRAAERENGSPQL